MAMAADPIGYPMVHCGRRVADIVLRLLSLSDDPWSLNKFNHRAENVEAFLREQGLDGLELMRWYNPRPEELPRGRAVGRHMPFWPNWLDFWRGDRQALLAEFDTRENYQTYYDAPSLEAFIQNRRDELVDANSMGIAYAVFHVSHVLVRHSYLNRFPYSDDEVVNAFIGLMNEMLKGLTLNYTLLFENHWFPGLTFFDGRLAMQLLDGIDYPNKGFVLDTSHLMNTNPALKDEGEAANYILSVLEGMGEARRHIQTVHLNSSRLWERPAVTEGYDPGSDYETRLIAAMKHVGGLDPHKPFLHPQLHRILDVTQPKFLVYELAANTMDELRRAVEQQNGVFR